VHPPAEASPYAQRIDFYENKDGTLGGFRQVGSTAKSLSRQKATGGDLWTQPRGPTCQMGDPLHAFSTALRWPSLRIDRPPHPFSGAPGASRCTSLAGLSSRNPTKTVCRKSPSAPVR
jgi:hypothetical protein